MEGGEREREGVRQLVGRLTWLEVVGGSVPIQIMVVSSC